MRVLEVIRQGEIGGGESHLYDLIQGFGDNIKPIVVAFSDGHMIRSLQKKGVKCYVIKSRFPFDITIQRKISRIIKQENIEIIHAHGSRAASSVILPSILSHKPLVYTVHGWSFHSDLNFIMYYIRILSEKIICSLCKQVICVSEDNKQLGIKKFNLTDKSIVIENGINLSKFNPNNVYKDIRKELKYKDDDFIVCFIGRITKQKAPYDFINSVIEANMKENNIKGLIIGDGDMRVEIEQYISKNTKNDIIKLQHFRNDIPDILNSIDVFALLSLWEGLSISLLEAMAMKKAIVITPTDGSREIMKDHVNSIIVPFKCVDKATKAYLELKNNEKEFKDIAQNAYELTNKRFDCERISKRIGKIYREIIT